MSNKSKIEQLEREIAFMEKVMNCKIQNAMIKGHCFSISDMKADIEKKVMELVELAKK